jgi:hypothetical protein
MKRFSVVCTDDILFNEGYSNEILFKRGEVYSGLILSPLIIRVEDENFPRLRGVDINTGGFLDNFIPMPFDPLEDKIYELTGVAIIDRKSVEPDKTLKEKVNQLLMLKSIKNGRQQSN